MKTSRDGNYTISQAYYSKAELSLWGKKFLFRSTLILPCFTIELLSFILSQHITMESLALSSQWPPHRPWWVAMTSSHSCLIFRLVEPCCLSLSPQVSASLPSIVVTPLNLLQLANDFLAPGSENWLLYLDVVWWVRMTSSSLLAMLMQPWKTFSFFSLQSSCAACCLLVSPGPLHKASAAWLHSLCHDKGRCCCFVFFSNVGLCICPSQISRIFFVSQLFYPPPLLTALTSAS